MLNMSTEIHSSVNLTAYIYYWYEVVRQFNFQKLVVSLSETPNFGTKKWRLATAFGNFPIFICPVSLPWRPSLPSVTPVRASG